MWKYEIQLQLNYSSGKPIKQAMLKRVHDELVAAFGSYAVPQQRAWSYKSVGCTEVLKIEIIAADSRVTWKRLKQFKEHPNNFLPQGILITTHELEVI